MVSVVVVDSFPDECDLVPRVMSCVCRAESTSVVGVMSALLSPIVCGNSTCTELCSVVPFRCATFYGSVFPDVLTADVMLFCWVCLASSAFGWTNGVKGCDSSDWASLWSAEPVDAHSSGRGKVGEVHPG